MAEDGRKDAAAVDVADQQGGQAELLRQPEVHVVAPAQVDLRRRSGSLADHQVVGGLEFPVGLERRLGRPGASAGVLAGLHGPARLPAQHDEGALIGRGLQQYRVVGGRRFHPGRDRLQVLGASDL